MFESLPPDVPPLLTCAECAWMIGVRSQLEYAAGWLCDHPSNIENTSTDPVTGLQIKTRTYYNCGEARKRENACGPEGRWFKLYERPARVVPPGKTAGAEALLTELERL